MENEIIIKTIIATEEKKTYELGGTYNFIQWIGDTAIASPVYITVDTIEVSDKWVFFYYQQNEVAYISLNHLVNTFIDVTQRPTEILGRVGIFKELVFRFERK